MIKFKRTPTLKTAQTVLAACIAGSVLTACQSTSDMASNSDSDDSEYELLSMKADRSTYNASASASAIISHRVTDDSNEQAIDEQMKRNDADQSMAYTDSTAESQNSMSMSSMPENETVHFAFDSASLSSSAKSTLDDFARSVNEAGNKDMEIRVSGFTDSTGPSAYNKKLSADRAASVESYLKGQIDSGNVNWDAESYGEKRPVANNDTAAGRQENRRVQLSIVNPNASKTDKTAMNY